MYKTSLLSCTAAAAIILFNIQFSVHAETLEVSDGKTVPVSDKTYETIHAKDGGKIIGKHLTIVTNKDINQDTNKTVYAVTAEGANSAIELLEGTTIKGTGSGIFLGLEAKDGATLQMTKGTITYSGTGASSSGILSSTGASFSDSKSKKNKLEDVVISSENDNLLLPLGISAKNSTVTLNNVTVTQALIGIFAEDHSTITVSGGSLDGDTDGVYAGNGSTITLNNNVTVASSKSNALHADGIESKITMKGGAVIGGSLNGHGGALFTENGGRIEITDVTLTTNNFGNGANANGFGSIIELKGKTSIEKVRNGLRAEKGGKITSEDLTITAYENQEYSISGIIAIDPNSEIQLKGHTTIEKVSYGLGAYNGGKITSGDLTIVGGKVIDQDPDEARSGVWTGDSGSEIQLTGKTTIQNFDEGLYADSGSKIISGDLTIIGGESEEATIGVSTSELNSIVELNGKTTIQNVGTGLLAIEGSTIKTSNGTVDTNSEGLDTQSDTPQNGKKNKIEAKKAALVVINGGHIDLTDVSATAEVAGLQFATFSDNDPNGPDYPQKYHSNEINLTNAEIHAENDTGILVGAFVEKSIEDAAAPSIGTVNLKKSEVHADVLLGDGIFWDKTSWKGKNSWHDKEMKAISNGTFTLSADQSTLEGRANIAKDRNVHFDLKNNTQWILKNSAHEKDDDGNLLDIAQRSRSDISTLHLDNSSIIFSKPTEEHYQTLHIGSGKPDSTAVYNAMGDAKIYFNAEWSDGAAINEQKTDRLLINGNVSGTTSVYVMGRLENDNVEANTSAAANVRGLSLIQVSGKAEESSFKLVNGYTTRGGLPDMYTLRAYGPDSSQGKANIAQNLFDEKNENFWDFRLQPELLGNGSGSGSGSTPDPETNIPAVAPVPQTASYLVMPNALFYSGLTDMAKQNALLANIRTSVLGKEEDKQTGFFLYTYGSTGTLSSERGPLKYGYGADIRYAALQAGVTLAAIEGQNTTTHLGLVGTYGQLSFTPKDMSDAGKNTLDKWSLTAYGSIQYNNGFYIDALLSYGILKGHIANALRGNTAKLNDAKMLSISTTVGKEFATGMEGLTFEPQAQVAYQHLMFNTIEDADNLTIDMNNPSQWLIRVSGRLTKTISTENSRPMSFYGKVNLIKTFGDDGTIHIGRDFDLDPMGPAIEGGIGINAQLSHNFSLHGDVSYQQKLQKTGISGASFSGGIRYQF
ncbi:autotransporter [Bartonella grahamii as4aup]|uniref:Type V secretory pathway, adhesin AidA n=2 Tax=Bartonella grahamii TaxID=33045 RepID=A0A336NEP3_BARGR|nr:autotransporter outer membrane beta-barrel domain-containing protein [Bartonella grahamii]ACS51240.1 autotransporter [Bartonella grahamii as4aup]SSZ40742.1 Type V secretory pathway, adhesin AidA [Bartonella grahamii]